MRTLFTFTLILGVTIVVQSQNSFKKVLHFNNNSNGYSAIQTSDGGFAICGHTRHDSLTPLILFVKTDGYGNTLCSST
jgi:hypothetical protein